MALPTENPLGSVPRKNKKGSNASVQTRNFAKKKLRLSDPEAAASESTSETSSQQIEERLAWNNAKIALELIKRGNATGNLRALQLRSKMQSELFNIGRLIQIHAGKILLLGLVLLLAPCMLLKSAEMEHNVEKLWVEVGGNLEQELEYVREKLGDGSGASNEMLIQTPVQDSSNPEATVLTPQALLAHLEVLKSASKVIVHRDDSSWTLKDLCYAQTVPSASEWPIVETTLENLFPCSIITPLDCFWEGSKLFDSSVYVPLGEGEGSAMLSWQSLNPMQLLKYMRSNFKYFDFRSFEEYMRRAGISTGYQEKPCLNPQDPDCPITAPNKDSNKTLDIGAELTGGCYGFATRYNHWPEQLVVGGTTKNKSGHIIKAKGLQSVVQLMGEKDFYDYWRDTYRTGALKWSQKIAKDILDEWQLKFSQEVKRLTQQDEQIRGNYQINTFSSSSLETVMEKFSSFSFTRVALGYALMSIYAGVIMFRWNDVIKSHGFLGMSGVVLVAMTIVSGLGICALTGIKFNASTSQILPYLSLGLGVDAIFLLVKSYSEQLLLDNIPAENHIGEVMSRTGGLIIIIATCLGAAFILTYLVIPIPAMRNLSLQAAILTGCNLVVMLFLFPALMALDLRRVMSGNMDVFCCFKSEKKSVCQGLKIAGLDGEDTCKVPSKFGVRHYSKFISLAPIKFFVTIFSIILTLSGLWGAFSMENGLSLTDVVPQNTSIFEFLEAQDKYFGFYHMYAVTKGNMEYPQNQRLLYDYQKAFVRVPNIIKDDDGGLPEFWLSLFRTWLVKIQKAFDENESSGRYHDKGWHPNATDDGILAFKLMLQTGQVDHPTKDPRLRSSSRLVDSHGIINPAPFYNYLSAWYGNDPMAYSFSQATIRPTPRNWLHDRHDNKLEVPKSPPIEFAQIPFYLNNLGNTQEMVSTIKMVREVCHKFEEKGLPNFPRGIPFTYWEQYLTLRYWLLLALAIILLVIFLFLAAVFVSIWTSFIAVLVISLMILQLFGLMNMIGIKLSAIPALLLILSAGIGVQFILHIMMGFVSSSGSKNTRVQLSLNQMLEPVFHGAISTLLGVVMLAFSEFSFVFKYFFLVIVGIIILGLYNGLVLLPIILTFIGPPAQFTIDENVSDPLGSLSRTSDPSKRQIKVEARKRNKTSTHLTESSRVPTSSRHNFTPNKHFHHSDVSLSTIAEESQSYLTSSQSSSSSSSSGSSENRNVSQSLNGANVFVEPKVVVKTTTIPTSSSGGSSRCSTPTLSMTKVTATASFKVELHAPPTNLSSSYERPSSRRSRRSSRLSSRDHDQSSPSVQNSLSDSTNSSLANSLKSNGSSENGDPVFSET